MGGGLTLSLMCPCGGGCPWNEEEGVVVMNISFFFFLKYTALLFSEGFCTTKCAPNACVSNGPVLEISRSTASGTSGTDPHHDHDQENPIKQITQQHAVFSLGSSKIA